MRILGKSYYVTTVFLRGGSRLDAKGVLAEVWHAVFIVSGAPCAGVAGAVDMSQDGACASWGKALIFTLSK